MQAVRRVAVVMSAVSVYNAMRLVIVSAKSSRMTFTATLVRWTTGVFQTYLARVPLIALRVHLIIYFSFSLLCCRGE